MNGETVEISVLTFVLILVRITTFFAVLPFFGRRVIPSLILIGLSLALANLEFWKLHSLPSHFLSNSGPYLNWVGFAMVATGEFAVGALLGMAFGLFIYPIQVAGSYLAQEMGLNMASLTDASTQSNSDVVSSLLQTLGLMLFFALELHHFIVLIISVSFDALPIARSFDLDFLGEFASSHLTQIEAIGLSSIAPIGICLFVVLIILILLTKAAPSMNIFSIGLSIRIGAGLFFMLLFLPHFLSFLEIYFENVQEWLLEYVGSFRSQS